MNADLLITHATVVTMDPSRRILDDGAVAVAGHRIVGVGPTAELEATTTAADVIDARGKALLPGLIDAHGHGGHSLIKTLGSDSPALWMRIVTPAYFHHTTPEFWYADGLISATERLRAGVTCGVSVMGSRPRSDDPSFGIGHARAYGQVGIREVVALGPSGLPLPHPASRWEGGTRVRRDATLEDMITGTEQVIEHCDRSFDDRIRVFVTPFTIVASVDPSNPSTPDQATRLTEDDRMIARRVREVAARWGVRIHSDAFGGMVRMAAQDDENALLGPDVHVQHCFGLSHEEVAILADTGTMTSHAPGGRAPVPAMIAAGLTMAVTTDGHAGRSYDLFQAARNAQAAQRIMHSDPYLLPPGKLLEMITIDAAEVLGWDDDLGSIEVGKKADLITVDLRQPHLVPNWMVVHRLVYEAVGRDVDMVIVDGRVVLRDGMPTEVDMAEVLATAEAESYRYVERAGLQSHLNEPGWGRLRVQFDEPVVLSEEDSERQMLR